MGFNGKEKDYESGFHYYGARYYWSETLTGWLSVDPMMDKYPGMSPYNYCAWNPMKLVDPDGEKIINAFIQHKDISQSVEFYKERIIADPGAKKQYENAIRDLEFKHEQYIKTQEAIDAFRAANADEYNIIDNLTFNGQSVDVLVGADLTRNSGNGGVFGKTEPKFLLDGNGKVVAIGNPSNFSIRVTLYGDAFLGETHGLGTIANEFGDVLFSVLRPDYAREQGLKLQRGEHTYAQDPSANFSYDYEYFICNPQKYKKPDPYDEKY